VHVADLEWYVYLLSRLDCTPTYQHQGLMYFCMDDMRAIKSLIDTLRIPSLESRVKTLFLVTYHMINVSSSGNHFRHVLRTFEYQDASLVQGLYKWPTTYRYVIPCKECEMVRRLTKDLTVYRKSGQASDLNVNDTDVQQRQPEPLRLTDQYIALLVLIFTNAGLLEVGC
jgi:rapamycin-insensitive companion of mTOR